ncbi:putative reverse transcriptase domain-containing protein [Tanacetum coccineum]
MTMRLTRWLTPTPHQTLIPQHLSPSPNFKSHDNESAAALAARDATRNSDDSHTSGMGARRPVQVAYECTYPDFLKCQPLNFKGTEGVVGLTQWFEKMKLEHAPCLRRARTPEAAHAMPWRTLKKMMTDKYRPRGEIKKLEFEMWNLKVKGTDVESLNSTLGHSERGNVCFECGAQGHFKKDCQKLKNNNNRGNRVGNAKAPGKGVCRGQCRGKPGQQCRHGNSEVFPETMPGIPPTRQVEFRIDLGIEQTNGEEPLPTPRIMDHSTAGTDRVIYSKIDLRSGYHQLRVREEDIPRTAFRTHPITMIPKLCHLV